MNDSKTVTSPIANHLLSDLLSIQGLNPFAIHRSHSDRFQMFQEDFNKANKSVDTNPELKTNLHE